MSADSLVQFIEIFYYFPGVDLIFSICSLEKRLNTVFGTFKVQNVSRTLPLHPCLGYVYYELCSFCFVILVSGVL